MTLDESFVAERENKIFNSSSVVQNFINQMTFAVGINLDDSVNRKTYLFPPNSICIDSSPPEILQELVADIVKKENSTLATVLKTLGFDSQQNYTYNELLNYLFYADYDLNYKALILYEKNANDLLFGSGKIISYENVKYDPKNLLHTIYDYFRKTAIYSPDVTCIKDYKHHERYIHNADNTTNLIPDTIDKSF